MSIRVALAEDSLIVREGIQQLLAADEDIEIVASCGDLDSLLEAVEGTRPDVVVTDIRMPPTETDEGIRLAAILRESYPDTGVVVLSQYAQPTYALELLDSGSDRRAYLLKQRVHDRAQLVWAIKSVASGGSVIDPKIVEALVGAKARSERSPLSELTPREREVLAEIAAGKSNTSIAESLVLDEARSREAHQLDLPQAEPVGGGGREQAREGDAGVPRRGRARARGVEPRPEGSAVGDDDRERGQGQRSARHASGR